MMRCLVRQLVAAPLAVRALVGSRPKCFWFFLGGRDLSGTNGGVEFGVKAVIFCA